MFTALFLLRHVEFSTSENHGIHDPLTEASATAEPCITGAAGAHGMTRHADERLIFRLSRTLAKPVARGHLDVATAEGTILAVACRAARAGTLRYDPVDIARVGCFALRRHTDEIIARRDETTGAIGYALYPLVKSRAASSRLRAAGHDVNACKGFYLSEKEAEEVVSTECWRAMTHRRQGARRNG